MAYYSCFLISASNSLPTSYNFVSLIVSSLTSTRHNTFIYLSPCFIQISSSVHQVGAPHLHLAHHYDLASRRFHLFYKVKTLLYSRYPLLLYIFMKQYAPLDIRIHLILHQASLYALSVISKKGAI